MRTPISICAMLITVTACGSRPLVGGLDGRCPNGEAPIPDGDLDVCVTTPMRDFLTCVRQVGKRDEAIRHVRTKKVSATGTYAGATASLGAEDNAVDEFSNKYADNNEVQTCREDFMRARRSSPPEAGITPESGCADGQREGFVNV